MTGLTPRHLDALTYLQCVSSLQPDTKSYEQHQHNPRPSCGASGSIASVTRSDQRDILHVSQDLL